MIIVRTPLRVSFFGGGTDHPGWFKVFGPGAVLSTTIDKYVYITLRYLPKIFDYKYRVAWRMLETTNRVDEIQQPVIREVLRHYAPNDGNGYEISYNADLPARSGLGSSSAFTVSALHALLQHQQMSFTKMSLAQEAMRVEQHLLGEPVGCQDQAACAFGGLNRFDFKADGRLEVSPIRSSLYRRQMLQKHLTMYFTGFTRDAGAIEKSKVQAFGGHRAQMERLYELVSIGQGILEKEDKPLEDFGALLDDAWNQKKALSENVSNSPIDAMYDAARAAGAIGGKLLGAGGGGFLLLFTPPERQAAVRERLESLHLDNGKAPVCVPIRLEDEGSSTVLFAPEFAANYER